MLFRQATFLNAHFLLSYYTPPPKSHGIWVHKLLGHGRAVKTPCPLHTLPCHAFLHLAHSHSSFNITRPPTSNRRAVQQTALQMAAAPGPMEGSTITCNKQLCAWYTRITVLLGQHYSHLCCHPKVLLKVHLDPVYSSPITYEHSPL
jgi:hypothetical protein